MITAPGILLRAVLPLQFHLQVAVEAKMRKAVILMRIWILTLEEVSVIKIVSMRLMFWSS